MTSIDRKTTEELYFILVRLKISGFFAFLGIFNRLIKVADKNESNK